MDHQVSLSSSPSHTGTEMPSETESELLVEPEVLLPAAKTLPHPLLPTPAGSPVPLGPTQEPAEVTSKAPPSTCGHPSPFQWAASLEEHQLRQILATAQAAAIASGFAFAPVASVVPLEVVDTPVGTPQPPALPPPVEMREAAAVGAAQTRGRPLVAAAAPSLSRDDIADRVRDSPPRRSPSSPRHSATRRRRRKRSRARAQVLERASSDEPCLPRVSHDSRLAAALCLGASKAARIAEKEAPRLSRAACAKNLSSSPEPAPSTEAPRSSRAAVPWRSLPPPPPPPPPTEALRSWRAPVPWRRAQPPPPPPPLAPLQPPHAAARRPRGGRLHQVGGRKRARLAKKQKRMKEEESNPPSAKEEESKPRSAARPPRFAAAPPIPPPFPRVWDFRSLKGRGMNRSW